MIQFYQVEPRSISAWPKFQERYGVHKPRLHRHGNRVWITLRHEASPQFFHAECAALECCLSRDAELVIRFYPRNRRDQEPCVWLDLDDDKAAAAKSKYAEGGAEDNDEALGVVVDCLLGVIGLSHAAETRMRFHHADHE